MTGSGHKYYSNLQHFSYTRTFNWTQLTRGVHRDARFARADLKLDAEPAVNGYRYARDVTQRISSWRRRGVCCLLGRDRPDALLQQQQQRRWR